MDWKLLVLFKYLSFCNYLNKAKNSFSVLNDKEYQENYDFCINENFSFMSTKDLNLMPKTNTCIESDEYC